MPYCTFIPLFIDLPSSSIVLVLRGSCCGVIVWHARRLWVWCVYAFGPLVAFANLRRLYVAPRVSQLDLSGDTFGIPPDAREVYLADDTYIPPSYMDIQFSYDSKYLLMQVHEGFTHFVVASLETGQSTPLAIPHMDPFVWDDNYVGDLSFFSWRQ